MLARNGIYVFLFFLQFLWTGLLGQDQLHIQRIQIEGNKKTKEWIITRELPFKTGDTIDTADFSAKLQQAEQNLMNLSLFNFVFMVPQIEHSEVSIRIIVKERWYTFPYPIFELADRNFSTWLKAKRWDRVNYGVQLQQDNCRGRRETLKLVFRRGYDQEYGISYEIPYIDKRKSVGIGLVALYDRSHETPVSSKDNQLLYFKSAVGAAIEKYNFGLLVSYRKEVHNSLDLLIGFNQLHISDSLSSLYPDFFTRGTANRHFFLHAKYKNDYRDIKAYPLKGHYFDVELMKTGFGFFENNPDVFSLKSSLRKYYVLADNWYAALGSGGKVSLGGQPYYYQRGLGYENEMVRGYQHYVVDGQQYLYGKANVKYALLEEQRIHLKWLPFSKFNTIPYSIYLNIFTDAGYAWDRFYENGNPLNNSFLFGAGIGLDYVTYYDKVIRLEWALNKQKESGIFIHLVAPI